MGDERIGLEVTKTVRLRGQHREHFAQVAEGLKQDRRIGLEEPQGGPLQDQIEVGDERNPVSLDAGGQGLEGFLVLLEVFVKQLLDEVPGKNWEIFDEMWATACKDFCYKALALL